MFHHQISIHSSSTLSPPFFQPFSTFFQPFSTFFQPFSTFFQPFSTFFQLFSTFSSLFFYPIFSLSLPSSTLHLLWSCETQGLGARCSEHRHNYHSTCGGSKNDWAVITAFPGGLFIMCVRKQVCLDLVALCQKVAELERIFNDFNGSPLCHPSQAVASACFKGHSKWEGRLLFPSTLPRS